MKINEGCMLKCAANTQLLYILNTYIVYNTYNKNINIEISQEYILFHDIMLQIAVPVKMTKKLLKNDGKS